MKLIIKFLAVLLLIVLCSLLLYQNHGVLLEKKSMYLISSEIFGFDYGVTQLPMLVYFVICILIGALFMLIPATALWVINRRLRKQLRRKDDDEQEQSPPLLRDPGDDLAYHIKEDE